MKYPTLDQADLRGKKVLLRAGFDVPIEDGAVTDTTRIEANIPTMRHILDAGGALIIMAHQGRPKGGPDPAFSQKPLIPVLEQLLRTTVRFADNCVSPDSKEKAKNLKTGEVLLLENLRFEAGEKSKDSAERDAFGKELASLADIYVNDAFTNCHRDHASMTSVPKYLPGFIGFTVQQEIEGLSKVTRDPRRPVTLIISGAKIETKVPLIRRFLDHGDDILVGGGIANTLLAARGFDIGASLHEGAFIPLARELMLESERQDRAVIHLPHDVVVGSDINDKEAQKVDLPVEDIEGDMAIFDIGKVSIKRYKSVIEASGTIVWNGPIGVYENPRFSHATKAVARAVAVATEAGAVSIIGGGDTLDFHERYGFPLSAYTFVSTAGGAMLDFISGKKLPALAALLDQ